MQQTSAGSRRTKVNLFARCCSSRSGHHELDGNKRAAEMFVLLAGSGELFRGFLSPATTNGHTTPWPGEVGLGRALYQAKRDGRNRLRLSAGTTTAMRQLHAESGRSGC